jgi:hypothetical protein
LQGADCLHSQRLLPKRCICSDDALCSRRAHTSHVAHIPCCRDARWPLCRGRNCRCIATVHGGPQGAGVARRKPRVHRHGNPLTGAEHLLSQNFAYTALYRLLSNKIIRSNELFRRLLLPACCKNTRVQRQGIQKGESSDCDCVSVSGTQMFSELY